MRAAAVHTTGPASGKGSGRRPPRPARRAAAPRASAPSRCSPTARRRRACAATPWPPAPPAQRARNGSAWPLAPPTGAAGRAAQRRSSSWARRACQCISLTASSAAAACSLCTAPGKRWPSACPAVPADADDALEPNEDACASSPQARLAMPRARTTRSALRAARSVSACQQPSPLVAAGSLRLTSPATQAQTQPRPLAHGDSLCALMQQPGGQVWLTEAVQSVFY